MKYLKNHKKIMLILTENCNLRCKYCYELNKQRSTMDFETARRILEKSLSEMDGYESAVIELHGGEPFLNFELIRRIDEFVIANYSFPVLFRSTTNGTYLNSEMKSWLYERRDRYEIMLSLDGMKEDHDLNRVTVGNKGSFELIDLDFFINTWENCPVSMTVSEETLPHLAANTIWIQEKGMDCLNAFQWATAWNLEKCYPILKSELKKLVAYYTEHPEKHMCLLVNYNMEKFNEPLDEAYRYCVDIDDPIECYDAKGVYAPCHGFTAFTMGGEKEASKFYNLSIRDFVVETGNICYGCRLIHLCRICFAANHMLTGDMQKQNREICIFNQLCILAGIQIERNRAKNSMSKDYLDLLDTISRYLIEKNDLDIACDYFA